jgi:negative regulator of replication initiation
MLIMKQKNGPKKQLPAQTSTISIGVDLIAYIKSQGTSGEAIDVILRRLLKFGKKTQTCTKDVGFPSEVS